MEYVERLIEIATTEIQKVKKISDGGQAIIQVPILSHADSERDFEFLQMTPNYSALFAADTIIGVDEKLVPCPFGKVGDYIRVAETWRVAAIDESKGIAVSYLSDLSDHETKVSDWLEPYDSLELDWYSNQVESELLAKGYQGGAEPSEWNHLKLALDWQLASVMPEWASRFTLKIEDISVARYYPETNFQGVINPWVWRITVSLF